MRILSAFCSVGIGETLIHQNFPGLDWIAIEIVPKLAREYKRRFPDTNVIIGDAFQYIFDHYSEFDVIIASPECQTYTNYNEQRMIPDERIFELILFLHERFTGKYFVENIKKTNFLKRDLPGPIRSTMERHFFWARIPLKETLAIPKRDFHYCGRHYPEQLRDIKKWLGVTLSRNFYIRHNHNPVQIYWEAYHPMTGLDVFRQILRDKNMKYRLDPYF